MMKNKLLKILSILLCFSLIFEQTGFAQVAGQLDISGHLAAFRNSFAPDTFRPLHLRYLSYDSLNNNFRLLLDKGSFKNPKNQEVEKATKELLNYFFIGITLPNDAFWVNLRPDAETNIIDNQLAQTDVGRILLESDLQLKKDTARFTSPETPEGKEYWDKLYQKAGEIFGSQNITIPTLTRPWIVPDEIIIRETTDSAYIYKATLKVMLEQDYLKDSAVYNFQDDRLKELNEYSSQLIREIIIPRLTQEINSSKRYAQLRQVYYSLIMAQWFKARFSNKDGLYSRVIDRGVVFPALYSKESWSKTTYFQDYQKSFKDGEYNIQESVYSVYGQTVRSYFSGGEVFNLGRMPAMGQVAHNPETGATISSIPTASALALNPKVVVGVKVNATDSPGELGQVAIENRNLDIQGIAKKTELPIPQARSSTDSIGKFKELMPVGIDEYGRLMGIIENIDTGEILNLSDLPQKKASFDEVEDYMHRVESLITATEMSVPERKLLEYILQLFRLNLPQNIIITQEVKAGFWGIGKPGLLVINQDILDNPIALLHEIIEYLKHKNPQIITQIIENLDEYGNRWLKGHIEKYGNNRKLDYLSENISHYIIRAFTRQVFGQKDIELSEKIKVSKYAKDFMLEYKEGKFVSLAKKTESPKAQEGDPIFAQRYRSLTEDESRIKFLRESYPIPGAQIEVVRIPPGPFTPRGTGRTEKVGENHYKITLFGVDGSYGEYLLFHEFLHIYLAENGFIFAIYHENEDVAHYLFELQNLINDYLIERENQRRFGDYYMGLTKELRDYDLQNQILFTAGSDRITNLRVFMLALTCKATVSLYPALSNSLSANTVGKVLTGGSLLEVVSEVSKLSLSDTITKYREAVCKVHELLTDDVAKFEGESFTFNVQEVSKFMDQIDALMNQLAQFKSMIGRSPSPEPPSISSTGIGHEREANRSVLVGILDIAVKQGLITKTDKVQRLRDFEVNPESALSEDIDLQTDNQSVFLINGQKVIVIDSDYLSTTEEGEQYASAGLRRGVVYITRVKFQEWQRQGVLEQKIKHEQDEVAYLRKKALEIFPGVGEATARDLLSALLKNPDNTKQARDLIGEAHNYAKAQEEESSSPGMQNGDTEKNNSVPRASLKDRISAWVREKLSYFQSDSSEITIEFPLEGDQFEIYQGGRKLGYLRYRIDDEFLKLDDLEIENEVENENIRQIIIQWVFGVASQFAGTRRFMVLAQAINNPNLVDALINSNLLRDIQIGGMIDGNYIAISAEEWRMRPRAKDISVTLRGTLNNNIAQPSTTIHESIPGLRSPSSSDIEFANSAAGFLIDFLGFDLVQKEEVVKNIVKNFRLKDSTRRGRGDLDKRWLKVAVLGSLSRNPGNGRQLGLGILTSHFWAVFGHEATHFLQVVYRFGFSKYDTGWKNESIPYAVSIYLSALGYGTDVNMVAKKMKSKKDADILIDAFILGYQSDISSVTAETVSRLMGERFYSTRNDEIWGATTGALIAGVAFRHYLSSGRWEDGRDIIRSFVISNNGDRARPLDSPNQDSISPSQGGDSLSTGVDTGDLNPSPEAPLTPNTARNFGGIDFRNLPIVTQAVGNLSANIGNSSINRFNSINLNSEWRDIANLVSSGITPSTERIKEYVQASCYKGSVDRDIDKVISCISDILRIEEERYSPTDPTLKDILVVLDSANSVQQLKAVFIGSTP